MAHLKAIKKLVESRQTLVCKGSRAVIDLTWTGLERTRATRCALSVASGTLVIGCITPNPGTGGLDKNILNSGYFFSLDKHLDVRTASTHSADMRRQSFRKRESSRGPALAAIGSSARSVFGHVLATLSLTNRLLEPPAFEQDGAATTCG
jgi:hypothetical protein